MSNIMDIEEELLTIPLQVRNAKRIFRFNVSRLCKTHAHSFVTHFFQDYVYFLATFTHCRSIAHTDHICRLLSASYVR